MDEYEVFISYRRDGGEMLAHILYERLSASGYRVFQDIESLRTGPFNTELYHVIESCSDFILVLSPHSLDRCVNEGDWVRQEIAHALACGKNIIPILSNGFEWPQSLPEDIAQISYYNGITASTEYFDMFLKKLEGFLKARPHAGEQKKQKHPARYVLLAAYIVGLLLPLFLIYVCSLPFLLWERILYAVWVVAGGLWLLNRIETDPQVAAACFGSITEEDLKRTPQELYSRVAGAFSPKILISTECPEGFTSYYRLRRLEFGSWDDRRINYLSLELKRSLEYYDPSVLYLHALSHGYQASKMLLRQGFSLQTTPDMFPQGTVYLIKRDLHVFLFYRGWWLSRVLLYQCGREELKDRLCREKTEEQDGRTG